MSTDQNPIQLRRRAAPPLAEADLGDNELLQFALGFAEQHAAEPGAARLVAEFGDVEVILATDADELARRGGLSQRAVGILKLLHAFRRDNRRGTLLH